MKFTTFTFCIMMISLSAFGQIEIRPEKVNNRPVLKPETYDSLKDISIDENKLTMYYPQKEDAVYEANKQLLKYIGQKIFFLPKTARDKEKEAESLSKHKSPIDKLRGNYYTITDFAYNYNTLSNHLSEIVVMLTDEKGGLDVWNVAYNFYEISSNNLMLVGYYEKTKSKSVGNSFVYVGSQSNTYIGMYNTNSAIDTHSNEIIQLEKGSVWNCTALQLIDDDYFMSLYCVFNNEKGNEIMVRMEDVFKTNGEKNVAFYSAFKEKKTYDTEKRMNQLAAAEKKKRLDAENAKRKQAIAEKKKALIAKFGLEIGTLISNNQVMIGMTKEMCREAWGRPYNINTTTVASGTSEQWCYSMKNYLYFDNGILTAIQN